MSDPPENFDKYPGGVIINGNPLERKRSVNELIAFFKSRQKVNLFLVIVNVAVFVVMSFLGDTEDAYFIVSHGGCYSPAVVVGKEYYRLFTSMFLHFGLEHMFYNMLMLLFLGDTLEKTAGKLRYLLIYLVGGLGGNIASVIYEWKREEYWVSAGASGAVFAVIGALACVVILNKGRLQDYSGPRLLMMAVLSILQGFTSSGTNYVAHVGGFAVGFLMALLFWRKLRQPENWNRESPENVKRDEFSGMQ